LCWSSTKQISSSHRKVTCSSHNDFPWGNFLLFPERISLQQNPPVKIIYNTFFCLQELYIVILIFIRSNASMFFMMINFKSLWFFFFYFRCIFELQTQHSIKHSLMFTYIWYYSFHTLLSIFQSVDHQGWYLKDCHPLHLNRTIVPKRCLRNQTMSMKISRMYLQYLKKVTKGVRLKS
jgi:hypothetical protein